MDLCFIRASIDRLLGATVESSALTGNVKDLVNRYVSDIRMSLGKMQTLLSRTGARIQFRARSLSVEDIIFVLTIAVTKISNLCNELALNEPIHSTFVLRLRSSKYLLKLIVTTLTW